MTIPNTTLQGLLGILCFTIMAWGLSEQKKSISVRGSCATLAMHGVLALLLSMVPWVRSGVLWVSQGVQQLKNATQEGTRFVFGYLGGGDVPFAIQDQASTFVFAFQALPMILVVSALSMVLFHWNILPPIVRVLGRFLHKTLGIGGPLGVVAGAKVFLGQTDAPLLIRPYLSHMSRSELFCVLTCGMATTSSTIMVVYGAILEHTIAHPLQHILTVSIISIPAALFFARLMVPPTSPPTSGDLVMPYAFRNTMEAIAQGTSDGLKIFLGVMAMLVVMLSLVALVNIVLQALPFSGTDPLSIQKILGLVMSPLGWLMGVPWLEATTAGQLLGTKMVTNEMVAFLDLARHSATLSPKTCLIMTYALCGFANLSSIGIVVGAFQALAPERCQEVTSLAAKAMIAGTLATCLSGTTIGLIYDFQL